MPRGKNTVKMQIYISKEEHEKIKEMAIIHGLSVSEYVRNISIGNNIVSRADKIAVLELSRARGDLGRVGGLLKLALTSHPKEFHGFKDKIYHILDDIEKNKYIMLKEYERVLEMVMNKKKDK